MKSFNGKKIFIAQSNPKCFVSSLECDDILRVFVRNGYILTKKMRDASIIIVSTCTTLLSSDRDSVACIEKALKRKRKHSRVIVAGCFAAVFKSVIEKKYDCIVVGPGQIALVEQLCDLGVRNNGSAYRANFDISCFNRQIWKWKRMWEILKLTESCIGVIPNPLCDALRKILDATYEYSPRAYFLRISQGCANFCSFCYTRKAVGFIKSRDASEIVAEMKSALEEGFNHFMLVADDFTSYGVDKKDTNETFVRLLEEISKVSGDFTLTLRNFNPSRVISQLESFVSTLVIGKVKSIEMPLQSGSDTILAHMNRGYTKSDYLRIVGAILEKDPGIQLKTQIIVGFPGETDKDFNETMEMVKALPFRRIEFNLYEEKPDTPSASFQNKVPEKEKLRRLRRIRALRFRRFFFE